MNYEIESNVLPPIDASDDAIATVYQTVCYGKFKLMSQNRKTDHVNALVASFKDRLVPNAILCNENYEIIDGQNRFLALRELGKPVLYYCIKGLDIYDVAYLNSYAKNWGTADFVKMWADLGKEEYQKIIDFKDDYPDLGLALCMMILTDSSSGGRKGAYLDSNTEKSKNPARGCIKNGTFKVKDIGHAHYVARCIMEYKPFAQPGLQIYKQQTFVSAMIQLLRNKDFDNAEMIRKIQLWRDKFYRCTTAKDYIVMLENLYNYRRTQKVRFI